MQTINSHASYFASFIDFPKIAYLRFNLAIIPLFSLISAITEFIISLILLALISIILSTII